MELGDVLWWMLVGCATWPAAAMAWRHRGVSAIAGFGTAVVAVALVAVAALDERAWQRLAREDGPVEWATVFTFLGAAAINVARVRARVTGSLAKLLLVGLVAFCVFVAGEEISWGQRLFAFQPPEAFLEHNFQQEFNVHNVLMDKRALGFELDSKLLVAAVAFVFGVLGPTVQRAFRLGSLDGIAPPPVLAPLFLSVVATEMSYPVDLAGEGAEMMLGLLFFGSALCAAPPRRMDVAAVALALPLALGAAMAPLVGRVLFGADEENSRRARAELELLRADVERGIGQRLVRKKGAVHKRVFTAARDGYLHLSGGSFLEGQATPADVVEGDKARRDRVGYFLDPWNNPYWVLWDKKSRLKAALYSFGPNRQRDTDLKVATKAAGDDILVPFAMEPASGQHDDEDVERGPRERDRREEARSEEPRSEEPRSEGERGEGERGAPAREGDDNP